MPDVYKLGLAHYAFNPTTGLFEPVHKTNDSRNALLVSNQHAQPLTNAQLRAAPLETTLGATDLLGAAVVGSRLNQIEVHFDDTNWSAYVNTSHSGGGGATQGNGQVILASSAGANGRAKATTLDVTKYRPISEVYAGWTAAFPVAGVANSYQIIGWFDAAFANGVGIGYLEDVFGIFYFPRNTEPDLLSAVVNTDFFFIPRSMWDDPCEAGVNSLFTRNGEQEELNPAYGNLYRVRAGLFGYAGFIVEVWNPDQQWIPLYTYIHTNTQGLPVFGNYDLPIGVDIRKVGAGAEDLQISTACWGGGTTSPHSRLNDIITDRSLAVTVRSVIEGKNPSGNYTKVRVNQQGRLQVDIAASGTPIYGSNTIAPLASSDLITYSAPADTTLLSVGLKGNVEGTAQISVNAVVLQEIEISRFTPSPQAILNWLINAGDDIVVAVTCTGEVSGDFSANIVLGA